VAEEIIFNRISTGASNDIKQATDLAQQMVRSWGMSDALGPLSVMPRMKSRSSLGGKSLSTATIRMKPPKRSTTQEPDTDRS
jgi:ATP-dependent Zn protease